MNTTCENAPPSSDGDRDINRFMIEDQGKGIAEALSLIICLKPEDDFPHPRHLCFKYPFLNTSPKKHCTKCYCYVCEEIAPCKKWNKNPQKHCQATEKDAAWRSLRQLIRKKLPGFTPTMAHHNLTISVKLVPNANGQIIGGSGGGLISSNKGEWISGYSMRLQDDIPANDPAFSLYTVLLQGLKLCWSQGFRYVDVLLGVLYHDTFWTDFKKDARTNRFRLYVDVSSVTSSRVWRVMTEVNDYLNREWFINVEKTRSFKDETKPFTLATMADCQAELNKVYDFTTKHHLTSQIMDIARGIEISNPSAFYAARLPGGYTEGRKYFGLDC